jgi:hypothetical protein
MKKAGTTPAFFVGKKQFTWADYKEGAGQLLLLA